MLNSGFTASGRSRVFWGITAVAVAAAIFMAARLAWTCDDAFISFAYSRNLLRGVGMVFNPGEYVEGETNFLWTVWAAVGMRFGVQPEHWANIWGVIFYGAIVFLLAVLAYRRGAGKSGAFIAVPLAALAAALHEDWNVFATSGLETAMFSFLALGGYAALVWRRELSERAFTLAGLLLALCSLTRPDGVIFVLCGGLYALWQGKPRLRAAFIFSAAFALIWVPFMAWRVWYYGDIFPNTYYAKSAYETWHSQGLKYLNLYFYRYWMLVAFPVLALAFAYVGRRRLSNALASSSTAGSGEQPGEPQIVFAALCCVLYIYYVVRVGGDFMFARLFLPAAPFLLIVAEYALSRLGQTYGLKSYAAVVCAFLVTLVVSPSPIQGLGLVDGIANERAFYAPEYAEVQEQQAATLKKAFEGLPVNLAFTGSQARVMYRLDIPLAIESETGLTDAFIARQILKKRGRPGHEKHAPIPYLLKRRVHLLQGNPNALRGQPFPHRSLLIDNVFLAILHEDPAIFMELKRRGAVEVPYWYGDR